MQRVPESVWNKVGLRHIKQAHVCQKLPARMNMWCTQQSNTIIFCFLNLLNTLEHLSNKQEHGKKKKIQDRMRISAGWEAQSWCIPSPGAKKVKTELSQVLITEHHLQMAESL